jgi:HlyD family secretion protein
MLTDLPPQATASRPAPGQGRRSTWIAAVVFGAGAMAVCMALTGYRPAGSRSMSLPAFETVEVDRGDLVVVVTENGTLESGDDSIVRCQVESFLGLPTGASPGRPTPSSQMARPRASTGASVASPGPGNGITVASPSSGQGKARSADRFGSVKVGLARSSGASQSAGNAPEAHSSSSGISPSRAPTPETTAASSLPEIRSFQYAVAPYSPLRTGVLDSTAAAGPPPPPPTILSIVPEGTQVKAGAVVCELDSSAFRRELLAQQARHVRAKGWVDKARSILEVNEITLREYEDGIFPQDVERIRQLILTYETERDLAQRNLVWSRATAAKGFRAQPQVEVDEFTLQKAEIALADARGMLNRLVNYTGKKVVKSIKAKIEAIRADLLSLESSFQLESDRLKRIEAMISNCTMRAPRDGMVIHANRANGWGRVDSQIQEGLTVYQSQPIFRILDPAHIQVKARINESQIAKIRQGQPALIRFDAFPDRPFRGTVADITPIPTLANGPISDVHSCFATVRFDSGGPEMLRLGLSAEVDFQVESRRQVTRIPLEAIRWAGDEAYAAISTDSPSGPTWRWKPIALGATDPTFAEVLSGLKPGDQVIAHSESLPAPEPGPHSPGTDVALARPELEDPRR